MTVRTQLYFWYPVAVRQSVCLLVCLPALCFVMVCDASRVGFVQSCFGYSGFLCCHRNSSIFSNLFWCENVIIDPSIEVALNLLIFGDLDFLTILVL